LQNEILNRNHSKIIDTRKLYAERIKTEAKRLGFSACGIAEARFLHEEADNLKAWLDSGFHAEMSYMQANFDLRLDPRLLVPGAKSVIVVLQNYFPAETQKDIEAPVLAKYAYGADYHDVVKTKLHLLHKFINTELAPAQGRAFTDSAPVLERKWAQLAGLGWQGKNGNFLTLQGSFFFIGELILDLDLGYDTPFDKNYCGSCTRCIDACPTQAIVKNKVIDSNLCISYQTIENKGFIDENLDGKFQNRVFGCDICQDVCPHNRKANPHDEPQFQPKSEMLNLTNDDWHKMTESEFQRIFQKSAVKRAKFKGLRRNLDFLKKNINFEEK